VIVPFVSLQRPGDSVKIWHWGKARTSRVMEEMGPVLLLAFGRLRLRQLLGTDRLQLLLPHLSKIKKL